jgi:hypothetical protein
MTDAQIETAKKHEILQTRAEKLAFRAHRCQPVSGAEKSPT